MSCFWYEYVYVSNCKYIHIYTVCISIFLSSAGYGSRCWGLRVTPNLAPEHDQPLVCPKCDPFCTGIVQFGPVYTQHESGYFCMVYRGSKIRKRKLGFTSLKRHSFTMFHSREVHAFLVLCHPPNFLGQPLVDSFRGTIGGLGNGTACTTWMCGTTWARTRTNISHFDMKYGLQIQDITGILLATSDLY